MEERMEIKDIVGWIVAIIVAVIGVSAITINLKRKNSGNTINQTINNGNGNIQAGKDVTNNQKHSDEV